MKPPKIKPASAPALFLVGHCMEKDVLGPMKKCGLAYCDLLNFLYYDSIRRKPEGGRRSADLLKKVQAARDALFETMGLKKSQSPSVDAPLVPDITTAKAALDSMRQRLGKAKFEALSDAAWRVFNIVNTLIDNPRSGRSLPTMLPPLDYRAAVKSIKPQPTIRQEEGTQVSKPTIETGASIVQEAQGWPLLAKVDAQISENWQKLSDEDKRHAVLFLGRMGESIEAILTTAEQKADAERIFGVSVREIFQKFGVPTKPA
jgi:hypothetical protein